MDGQPPPAAVEEEVTPPPVEEGAPTWTVTFGDMMSLLLTFFILLFSMSELKVEQFLLASQSLREALGGTALEAPEDPMGLMPDSVDPDLSLDQPGPAEPAQALMDAGGGPGGWLDRFSEAYLRMIEERFKEFIEENDLEGRVEVTRDGEGVFLRIETATLFGSGEARLRQEGLEVLEYLSRITRELEVGVVVSGHADNQAIRSVRFASNWELSAARAAGVARILVADGHSPELVRVESYGEFKPVADNSTPEGRAKNRRVELFYAREDVRKAALRWASGAGEVD
jgi:chemotaxis protein MotB